jgi:regulator of replication initiation timing
MSGMNIDGQAPVVGNMEQLQQFIAQQVQQHTAPLQNQVAELNERNQQTELHNQQLQQALNVVQAGHNMGQQHNNGHGDRARAAQPSRYDGSLGSDAIC